MSLTFSDVYISSEKLFIYITPGDAFVIISLCFSNASASSLLHLATNPNPDVQPIDRTGAIAISLDIVMLAGGFSIVAGIVSTFLISCYHPPARQTHTNHAGTISFHCRTNGHPAAHPEMPCALSARDPA
jgi:hypothetical protein